MVVFRAPICLAVHGWQPDPGLQRQRRGAGVCCLVACVPSVLAWFVSQRYSSSNVMQARECCCIPLGCAPAQCMLPHLVTAWLRRDAQRKYGHLCFHPCRRTCASCVALLQVTSDWVAPCSLLFLAPCRRTCASCACSRWPRTRARPTSGALLAWGFHCPVWPASEAAPGAFVVTRLCQPLYRPRSTFLPPPSGGTM